MLADLVGTQLKAFGTEARRSNSRARDVRLNPTAAQTIGLALHELATNAAKYGALSNQVGQIHIACRSRTNSS